MELLDNIMKSPILYGLIAMFLAVYGPRLHPALPISVRNLFNNSIFRFLIILVIIYMSSRDLTLSLTIAIGFLVIISLTNMIDIRENLMIHAVETFVDQEEEIDSGLDQPVQQFYGQEQFSSEANAKAKADMAKQNADTIKELETSIQGLESKLTDTCSKTQFDKLVDNKEATDMLKGFCNKHSVGTKEQFQNYSQVVENYKF